MRTILAVVMSSGLAAAAAIDDQTLATEGNRWWSHLEVLASDATAGRDRLAPTMQLAEDRFNATRGQQFGANLNPANADKIVSSSGHPFAELESQNVIGILPGSDPVLKNEYHHGRHPAIFFKCGSQPGSPEDETSNDSSFFKRFARTYTDFPARKPPAGVHLQRRYSHVISSGPPLAIWVAGAEMRMKRCDSMCGPLRPWRRSRV